MSLPTTSMVMVRRWSLSVVQVVIDLFVLVLIAALTVLWVGHRNHYAFEANSYHASRYMNIYFASQTRQVEILFQRQASDLTRRRLITSSSVGGDLVHCHIWLAVTCHLSSCYWLCLVSANYASPHIIPSWCDPCHDVLQRFFNLMPHLLYGPAVQTFEFDSYLNHSCVSLILPRILVSLVCTLGPDTYSLCFHFLIRCRDSDHVFFWVWVH